MHSGDMRHEEKLFLYTEHNATKKFANLAVEIAFHNFYWRYPTLVILNTTVLSGVETFLKGYQKNVEIGAGVYFSRNLMFRQYVLFITNIATLKYILNWMNNQQFNNIGKYIVICDTDQIDACNEHDVMDILWINKIVNVVYLNRDTQSNVNIYTYYYDGVRCRNGPPVKLEVPETCGTKSAIECLTLFPQKLSNLHKCPLIVSTFDQKPYMYLSDHNVPSGADGDLLNVIAETLNARLEVITPRSGFGWGYLSKKGVWKGSLGDIYKDLANFSMTSCAITQTRFIHFEHSFAYNTMHLVWYLPNAQLKPAYLKLFLPFNTMTQCAVLMTYLPVLIFAFIVKGRWFQLFAKRNRLQPIRSSLIFFSWIICMGLPSTKLPRQRHYLQIVLFWIWYCFLLRTFYQAYLIGSLKNQYFYPELESLEDAMNAGYEFGGGLALKDYYINYPKVYHNWKELGTSDIYAAVINISKGLRFALATGAAVGQAIIRESKISVHVLPEDIVTSPVVVFFKKYSPLAEPINGILFRLIEAGLTSKFYNDYTQFKNKVLPNDKVPMNMGHFTGCYAILGIGWTLSFLSFIVEIIYYRYI